MTNGVALALSPLTRRNRIIGYLCVPLVLIMANGVILGTNNVQASTKKVGTISKVNYLSLPLAFDWYRLLVAMIIGEMVVFPSFYNAVYPKNQTSMAEVRDFIVSNIVVFSWCLARNPP